MGAKLKEANFQKRLIENAKEQGHRIKKMQSGMGYVVLDIYIRHLNYGAQWWELKTIGSLGEKVKLTRLQRNEIRDEILAGGFAGCVVCIKHQNKVESIYVLGMEDTHVRPEQHVQDRRTGQPYDITGITNAIIAESERLRLRFAKGELKSDCGFDQDLPRSERQKRR